jgi:hypothetical protein
MALPWEPLNMTPADWAAVTPSQVLLSNLVFDHPRVPVAGKLDAAAGRWTRGDDLFPHVVRHDGRLHAADSDCRLLVAAIRGLGHVPCRVIER